MPLTQALAWVQAGELLLSAGIATVNGVKSIIKSLSPNITDADLNAILSAIATSSAKYQLLAQAGASGTPNTPA